jgi:haloalkane dehalogenase
VIDVDVHRTPDERFAGLPGFPFEPRYVEIDGLRMHHLDEGDPSAPPILLLHGEPSWSYLYRTMIPPLVAAGFRCVAPDYFGFGRSDKPTDRAFYTYDGHVASIAELVKILDLSDVTLVGQDWGGPIGFRVAVEDPDRVAALVVLNTGILAPSDRWPTPAFLRWREFAERAGLDLPVGFVMESGTATDLSSAVIAAYEAPFDTPESKTGAAMFPLLVPVGMDDPGAAEMLATREALARWTKPAFVCFGDADPIFPPKAAEAIARLFPTAGRPELVAGAAHFVQEDAGDDVARRMLAFLRRS